jgi:electron transfer flavoprotein beta subunit
MKAKRKEIETIIADDLLSEESLAPATKFYAPERKKGGLVLEGDLSGMVEKLVGLLKEKTAVLR